MLLLEYDGITGCGKSRHITVKGFTGDCEKLLGRGWLEAMIDTAERERAREALETAVKYNMPFRDTWRIHNRQAAERFIATVGAQMIRNRDGEKLIMFGSLERTRTIREGERTDATIPASEETPTTLTKVQ